MDIFGEIIAETSLYKIYIFHRYSAHFIIWLYMGVGYQEIAILFSIL